VVVCSCGFRVSASTPIPMTNSGISALASEGWKENPKAKANTEKTANMVKALILLIIPLLFLGVFVLLSLDDIPSLHHQHHSFRLEQNLHIIQGISIHHHEVGELAFLHRA
jgi:hypothetical protein